ncbi:B12-binding domain-containing radical SAM protein [bacterium]|nr:B12-binding domain-containing radical SAM protein [bacterium]
MELRKIANPAFLLAFPPMQFTVGEMIRPDGTLALPYLSASLNRAGYRADILDMSVGSTKDTLEQTFYREERVTDQFVRVGMTHERILQEVRDYDVIGLTSIFTQQTSRCFEVSQLIKKHYPEKILIAGGVNARSLRHHFFDNGFDVVFLSESEIPIVQFARHLERGGSSLQEVPGIAYRQNGQIVINPVGQPVHLLDEYPMPAWEKLPNEKYWEISRLFGGKEGWLTPDSHPKYAALITSRGCPFRCTYCHISKERGAEAGDIGDLRLHSVERVADELDHLHGLGVDTIFINDDSFLAKKARVFQILDRLRKYNFTLADVNGVNIAHLFTRHAGDLVVDEDLLIALYEAGFRRISIPFESGTQRIISKYSTGKWNLQHCDVLDLVRKMNRIGIVASGNFMIGYPDETQDELTNTFMLARRAMDAGLAACSFFMVQPFPGTLLFEESIQNGQLSPNWHWDDLGWSKGSPFNHPKISKDVLKYTWELVWKLLNRDSRVGSVADQLSKTLHSDPIATPFELPVVS